MKIHVAVSATKIGAETKLLVKALDKALVTAGMKRGSTKTKSGVHINFFANAGIAYDHAAPMEKRGPSKKAPMYYRLSFDLTVEGKTRRITSDGPIENSESVASYVHRFPSPPTAADVKAVMPELQKRLNEAAAKYKELVKQYNKTKK